MYVLTKVSNSTPFDTIQHHMTPYIWCQDTKQHHSTLVCFFKFWQKMMIFQKFCQKLMIFQIFEIFFYFFSKFMSKLMIFQIFASKCLLVKIHQKMMIFQILTTTDHFFVQRKNSSIKWRKNLVTIFISIK